MMAEEHKDVFLSCFKCGRIVRAGDSECPRCGLQFGPGTLFECPFCSGLVWRNASKCNTCGIDLTEFSMSVERTFSGFDMDEFVENIINTELEQMRSSARRVACPGCGLMIRGDEDKCPRCDLPLGEVSLLCPVCGEKMPVDADCCPNCKAVFEEEVVEVVVEAAVSPEEISPAEEPVPELLETSPEAEAPPVEEVQVVAPTRKPPTRSKAGGKRAGKAGKPRPKAPAKGSKKPSSKRPAKKPAKKTAKTPAKKSAGKTGPKKKPAKKPAKKAAAKKKSKGSSAARRKK